MRELFWWAARQTRPIRGLMQVPWLAPAIRRAGYLLLPSETVRTLTVRGGIGAGLTLELNPRWQQRMWQGNYEPRVQEIVSRFSVPGRTIYDVGGGIGFYSLAAARLGARVFTFEPDPANRARIESHASANDLLGRFDLMPIAVFSRTGSLSMEPSKPGHGHGHAFVTEVWDSGKGERMTVPCVTLDDFARDHAVPDLIKIDVEGCEAEVVRGAERLMRNERPAILCEVHNGELAGEVERLIRDRGYQLEWVQDADYDVRWAYATPGQP